MQFRIYKFGKKYFNIYPNPCLVSSFSYLFKGRNRQYTLMFFYLTLFRLESYSIAILNGLLVFSLSFTNTEDYTENSLGLITLFLLTDFLGTISESNATLFLILFFFLLSGNGLKSEIF